MESIMYSLPLDELKPIFKQWIKEAVTELMKEPDSNVLEDITTTNGFVTEKQAKKILSKSTTWFWEMRTNGKLPYKKLGATVYYKLDDVKSLLLG